MSWPGWADDRAGHADGGSQRDRAAAAGPRADRNRGVLGPAPGGEPHGQHPVGLGQPGSGGHPRQLPCRRRRRRHEPARGEYFVDTDLYKWLEAAGWELGRGIADEQTAALAAYAREGISLIQAAQAPDGYLDTWFQLRAPQARFTDLPAAHELYCAGHLIQAALAHSRALGDDRLLAVAERFADYLGRVFGPGRLHGVPGHPEVEMALVELYRATGRGHHLDLARYFIDARGHRLLGEGHYGARYRQDDAPFRPLQARGHAVRAAYLACGALDVSAETGDRALLSAAVAQWEDMVARRMYLTGGVGTHHKDEAFGDPFELPPDRAYCETCAAIGVVMWSWRLLLATGESRYADLIERVLFNAFSVGTSLRGDTYFYVNPLQVRAGRADPEDGRGRAARSPWYDIACCPPNVMRTLSSLPHYLATSTPAGLQLWQFAPARLSLRVSGGLMDVAIETGYPLSGPSRCVSSPLLKASSRSPCGYPPGPSEPAGNSGTRASPGKRPGSWQASCGRPAGYGIPAMSSCSDCRSSPAPVRPHPRIDAVRGCAAFERGPLVYCLEEADAGGAEHLESLRIPGAGPGPVTSRLDDEPVVLLQGEFEPQTVTPTRSPTAPSPGTRSRRAPPQQRSSRTSRGAIAIQDRRCACGFPNYGDQPQVRTCR